MSREWGRACGSYKHDHEAYDHEAYDHEGTHLVELADGLTEQGQDLKSKVDEFNLRGVGEGFKLVRGDDFRRMTSQASFHSHASGPPPGWKGG